MSVSINQLRAGETFLLEGAVAQVEKYEHIKMGRGGAVIRLRMRNLQSGVMIDRTFKNNDHVELVEVNSIPVQFLYRAGNSFHFMNPITFEQYELDRSQVGDAADFLTEAMNVIILRTVDQVLSIRLPTKVDLGVVETSPIVKGATISQVTKPATLISGVIVQVPGFIKVGDTIRVNTETRTYVERI